MSSLREFLKEGQIARELEDFDIVIDFDCSDDELEQQFESALEVLPVDVGNRLKDFSVESVVNGRQQDAQAVSGNVGVLTNAQRAAVVSQSTNAYNRALTMLRTLAGEFQNRIDEYREDPRRHNEKSDLFQKVEQAKTLLLSTWPIANTQAQRAGLRELKKLTRDEDPMIAEKLKSVAISTFQMDPSINASLDSYHHTVIERGREYEADVRAQMDRATSRSNGPDFNM